MIKVVKFGGSSVANAKQFKKVKEIVLSDPSRKLYYDRLIERKIWKSGLRMNISNSDRH